MVDGTFPRLLWPMAPLVDSASDVGTRFGATMAFGKFENRLTDRTYFFANHFILSQKKKFIKQNLEILYQFIKFL